MSEQLPRDPMILLSVSNTKLRDYYQNLDLLCEDLQISKEYLEAKLDAIDFEYDAERNQFV